jgi:hypothetical protein
MFGPEAARLVAREAGDNEALVAALRAEAWFERTHLAHDRATVLLDEAVRVAREDRLDALLGQVLVTRGAVNHELGLLTAAKQDFDQAARLVDPAMAAELLSQQAALYQNMGRLSDAAVRCRQIMAEQSTPPEVRWKAANNLGIIEAQCGRSEAATCAGHAGGAGRAAHGRRSAVTGGPVGAAAQRRAGGPDGWRERRRPAASARTGKLGRAGATGRRRRAAADGRDPQRRPVDGATCRGNPRTGGHDLECR